MTPTDQQLQRADNDRDNAIVKPHFFALHIFIVLVLLIGAIAATIALRIFLPDQPLRMAGPASMALLAGAGGYFVLRRQMQVATRIFAFGAWTAVTAIALGTGGVNAPSVIAYPLIILLTGWLVNAGTALILGGLTVGATLCFAATEYYGFFLPPRPLQSQCVQGIKSSSISCRPD